MDKNLYEVTIAGTPMKLRSSHGRETVDELIALVNEKVDQAFHSGSQISFQNALLLASLHIAEDLVLLKSRTDKEMDRLEKRTEKLLQDLEASPLNQIGVQN